MTHPLDSISLGKIVQIREVLLKAQATGKKVYRFESGDPNFDLAPHILESIAKAGQSGKTHYIPNNGIPELRRALAKKLKNTNGLDGITDEHIFVTNGAMHALYVVFSTLLSEGSEVIVPDPMWTEVVENIRLAGGKPVPVVLKSEHDFVYRPEDIAAKITSKTKAIFLNTPHNPTGAVLGRETLLQIAELARAKGLWIISDEAYEDVIFAPHKHVSIASLAPDLSDRTVSIYSFSKSHAMSGLRVGYLVTKNKTLMDRIPKLLRCTINGVNSLAQWAALAATEGTRNHIESMKTEYLLRRDLMMASLKDIPGLKPFEPRGSFFIWAEVDPSLLKRLGLDNVDQLSANLAEVGLGSSPGDAFGQSCELAIRFAFSCSTEMIREGAPKLRNYLLGTTINA